MTKHILILSLLLILFSGCHVIEWVQETPAPQDYAVVTRVVDGDTIKVDINGTEYTVRYIGIDTPETVDPRKPVQCFGKAASDKNKELVLGKAVRLEGDVSGADSYGRLLKYVYLEDGTFINLELVRQGYATAWTYPPDVKYSDLFVDAEREAREANRGLWGVCDESEITTH